MTTSLKAITINAAYTKGRRCQSEDMQDGMMRFVVKYCSHNPWSMCELCRAWHNGFDNQLEQWRHEHAKKCPLGVGDPGNHEHCDID